MNEVRKYINELEKANGTTEEVFELLTLFCLQWGRYEATDKTPLGVNVSEVLKVKEPMEHIVPWIKEFYDRLDGEDDFMEWDEFFDEKLVELYKEHIA